MFENVLFHFLCLNRVCHVKNSMLASSAVDLGFKSWSEKMKLQLSGLRSHVRISLTDQDCQESVMVSKLSIRCGRLWVCAPVGSRLKFGICCFSAKYAALRRKSKDGLAQNQDNMSGFKKLHMGLVVLVKEMSVFIHFLLQNTNLVSVLTKIFLNCAGHVWQDWHISWNLICLSEATCLSADYCFSELALLKSN